MAQTRPDLDGLRFRMPGHPAVYLIDGGKKRHLPNPQTYNALFEDGRHIHLDINIDEIETGDRIPETALLFRHADRPAVYLLDGEAPNQIKRHVRSPAVMERFHFNWRRIHILPPGIDFPDGPPLTKEGIPN